MIKYRNLKAKFLTLLFGISLVCNRYNVRCSSMIQDPVFSSENAKDVNDINVGVHTGEASPPPGHMKMLGDHAEPIPGGITELDYMVGGKDFYEHFVRKRRPVIFRGVTKNWMSTKQWKNESYLMEKYADIVFDIEVDKIYDGALNTRTTMTMREFLAKYKTDSLYLDSPFPQSPMIGDLELPLMLQCEEGFNSFTSMHLLYSNGNTSSPLHHDGYENFLSVFSGQKVVWLMEPKYGKEVYVSFVQDFPGLSPINPEHVDLLKFPLFKDVPFYKVVINPGDMLYIPEFWFHQVRSFQAPNIAASMWFTFFDIPKAETLNYRDVLDIEENFRAGVDMAPETVECRHQNRLMHEVYNGVNLREFPQKEEIVSELNKVSLYDEVKPGQPILYAGSDDSYIYAVDMLTGSVKWKIKTEQDTGSTCAFSKDNSLVYCGADDGRMRAMFTRNGTLKWEYVTGGAIVSSVVLDEDGNLYFGCLDFFMYSINSDGQKRWTRYLGHQVWSTPFLLKRVLFIGVKNERNDTRTNVFALEMSTGAFVWRYKVLGGVVATPRLGVTKASVYYCSLTGNVYALGISDGKATLKASFNDSGDLMASPAMDVDGIMYILLSSGHLIAFDTSTSTTVWEKDLKIFGDGKSDPDADRGSSSSPLLAFDGRLYVGCSNGIVYAIQPEDGEIIWKQRIGTSIFFSSPRLSKERVLYIGTIDGPLFALDAKNDGKIIWSMHTEKAFVGTALITKEF